MSGRGKKKISYNSSTYKWYFGVYSRRSFDDLEKLRKHGRNRINFTIGSALDLFGGELSFEEIVTKF